MRREFATTKAADTEEVSRQQAEIARLTSALDEAKSALVTATENHTSAAAAAEAARVTLEKQLTETQALLAATAASAAKTQDELAEKVSELSAELEAKTRDMVDGTTRTAEETSALKSEIDSLRSALSAAATELSSARASHVLAAEAAAEATRRLEDELALKKSMGSDSIELKKQLHQLKIQEILEKLEHLVSETNELTTANHSSADELKRKIDDKTLKFIGLYNKWEAATPSHEEKQAFERYAALYGKIIDDLSKKHEKMILTPPAESGTDVLPTEPATPALRKDLLNRILDELIDLKEETDNILKEVDKLTAQALAEKISEQETKLLKLYRLQPDYDWLNPAEHQPIERAIWAFDNVIRSLEQFKQLKLEQEQAASLRSSSIVGASHTPTVVQTSPVTPASPVAPPYTTSVEGNPDGVPPVKSTRSRSSSFFAPVVAEEIVVYAKAVKRHKKPVGDADTDHEMSDDEHVSSSSEDYKVLLTAEEITDFKSKGGLDIISPSGEKYQLSYVKRTPEAVINHGDCKTEAEQIKFAQTIINMIDNVLSKSIVIKINTSDPFVAQVATQYIDYLKSTVDLDLNIDSAITSSTDPGRIDILDKEPIKTALSRIPSAPWYAEAKTTRSGAAASALKPS